MKVEKSGKEIIVKLTKHEADICWNLLEAFVQAARNWGGDWNSEIKVAGEFKKRIANES